MNADILNDLAARVEAGSADMQGRLLEEAWDTLAQHSAAFRAFACAPCSGFGTNAGHFSAMLDAHAYESAAMALAPEGWRGRIFIGNQRMGVADIGGPHSAFFTPADTWEPDQSRSELCWSPALSVCAAALRAHASIANENKFGV